MVDFELYGGKRGYLDHLQALLMCRVGAYRSAGHINWSHVERLVFVCKGNICRSPYASARAMSLGANACSCGFQATIGSTADPAAIRNAALRRLDLTSHRSTSVASFQGSETDLIIVFEPAQLIEAQRHYGVRSQITLLGLWSRPRRPWLQDPYGRSDRYFQQCFSVIDAAVLELVKKMDRGVGQRSLCSDAR